MNYFTLILTSFLLLTSAPILKGQSNKVSTIKGTLNGFPENSLIRLYAASGRVIDSCYLKDSRFVLQKPFDKEAGPLGFRITKDSMDNSTQLFIGNENISMRGSKKDFPDKLKVIGSVNHKLMKELDQILADVLTERRNLLSEYLSIRQSGKMTDSIWNMYWGQAGSIKMLDDETHFRQKKFISKNINSYYALHLLSILKTEYKKDELLKLMDRLSPIYKNSKYAYAINTSLNNDELKIGDKFIDFKAFNKDDESVHFSNFFSEKYVLLDFSTPYCQFCIKAIEPLKKLAQENTNNLEIVTFYVDEEKSGYSSFLDKSQKPWSVIWDKNGRFGDAYSSYHINGTPTFFLFDKKGNLVQIQDGFDEDFFENVVKTINTKK
jgi:thiol-disulfide isomerase/thioredoxin